MNQRYAANTEVDSFRSRAEIERILTRYGATSFAYSSEPTRAAIAFELDNHMVRFVLPMPNRNNREFTHTPSTEKERSPTAAAAEYEKAVRQSWRALALVVKAKLEAVAAGIVTFEEEFYAHLVLPNGRTVWQETTSAVELAFKINDTGPLQIGPGR